MRYESNSVSKTGQLEAILGNYKATLYEYLRSRDVHADEHHERCRERIEVLGSTDDLVRSLILIYYRYLN